MARPVRSSGINPALLVTLAVLAIVVVAVVIYYLVRSSSAANNDLDEPKTFNDVATPRPAATGTAAAQNVSTAVPSGGARSGPKEVVYKGCPGEGDGTDPELNRLKNRVDEPPSPAALPFHALEGLAWPAGVNKKHMGSWTAPDRAAVEQHNGLGVSIEAYLIRVKSEGAESNNCHSTAQSDVDFHVWIVANQADSQEKGIVVELNPRLRAQHPGWTLAALEHIARQRAHVRVTGWTMLDPEHPDQVGKTRGTIWEIHPVTKIELDQGGGQWQTLQ